MIAAVMFVAQAEFQNGRPVSASRDLQLLRIFDLTSKRSLCVQTTAG